MGGAAACQLCTNRSTRRVRRDMHAHGTCERCRHAITEAEKKVADLQHHLYPRNGVPGGFGQPSH